MAFDRFCVSHFREDRTAPFQTTASVYFVSLNAMQAHSRLMRFMTATTVVVKFFVRALGFETSGKRRACCKPRGS